MPCMDCARGVVQSGIIRVVATKPEWLKKSEAWKDSHQRSEWLFGETHTELVIKD